MFALDNAKLSLGGKTVLSAVTAGFPAGSLTAIIGPNGAGKSTLLKLLSGEIRPSGGFARLDGEDIADLKPTKLAGRRAVLPQTGAVGFSYTAYEVVRLGLEARRPPLAPSPYDDPREALKAVDLDGFAGRLMHQLSGGEQQRVHLARVLCQVGAATNPDGPRFLFLDEPTASLDIRHQLLVMQIARRFVQDGGGGVMVLHDLTIAGTFADRLLLLDRGRVAADGSPEDVLTEERLAAVFGVSLAVGRTEAGGLYVLPAAPAGTS